MEKAQEHKQSHYEKPKSHVWDCGSTLYDSFELNSFKRQLDSAIATRTFSMSRIPDRQAPPPPPPQASKSKRPRSYPGHFTSFSGQCSSQNHLPVLWFEFKINPRMDFTSFTISPGHLPPFLKLLRLILVSFRRKSVPW